jgi:hypothetical protein
MKPITLTAFWKWFWFVLSAIALKGPSAIELLSASFASDPVLAVHLPTVVHVLSFFIGLAGLLLTLHIDPVSVPTTPPAAGPYRTAPRAVDRDVDATPTTKGPTAARMAWVFALTTLMVWTPVAAVVTVTQGCGANGPLITSAAAQLIQCVATQLLQSGTRDPMAIATACSATAIVDVVAIVDAVIAASTTPVDAGAPPAATGKPFDLAVAKARTDAVFLGRLYSISAAVHARLGWGQ